MTSAGIEQLRRRALLLYATGFFLLLVALLSPPGVWDGEFFLKVAQESPWNRWWDWPAAWCSVKVILLSLGLAALVAAAGTLARSQKREVLGRAFLWMSLAASLGAGAGAFLLVKALL